MALFVDVVTITVKAGDGGNGCVSFHREKFVQAGGPDGGDGGRGGDVIFEASERMHTLMDFRYKRKFTAGNGGDGMANRRTGKSGEPVVIEVPPGTVVREKATGKLQELMLIRAQEDIDAFCRRYRVRAEDVKTIY
jgi:GTP-binding protein